MAFFKNLGNKMGLPDVFNQLPRFGALLRQYRTLHGISIEDLAAAVEIAPGALREIEEGKRPAPSEKKVRAICKALRLDSDEVESLTDSADLDSPVVAALTGRAPAEVTPSLSASIFVFLIADIRGYTSFTQRYGDKAAARLTLRFAEAAHAALESSDGRLVEARGDEILGVFASARQALRAAHDLHARYAEMTRDNPEWPDGVGIGLDVGEAEQIEGGYRGAALNRASRLCALAGPGETLVTTGVAYVAPHVEGVAYIARGQEQLKGMDGSVPILLATPSDAGIQTAIESEPASGPAPLPLPPATNEPAG
jgi:class 3 adenylate cyclase